MKKKITSLLLAIIIAISCIQPVQIQAAASPWKNAYGEIIKNWQAIERISGYSSSYLKMFFGKKYTYDKYFLCDVDGNKVPELFLYSSKMQLTAVFTYSNNKVTFLSYDNYYKINRANHTLVVKGHWHGSGGSGTKEYSIYKIKKDSIKQIYYIDNLNGRYSVYKNENWSKANRTKSAYNNVYKKYVKGGKNFSKYKKYKLSDKKGLSKIQK